MPFELKNFRPGPRVAGHLIFGMLFLGVGVGLGLWIGERVQQERRHYKLLTTYIPNPPFNASPVTTPPDDSGNVKTDLDVKWDLIASELAQIAREWKATSNALTRTHTQQQTLEMGKQQERLGSWMNNARSVCCIRPS